MPENPNIPTQSYNPADNFLPSNIQTPTISYEPYKSEGLLKGGPGNVAPNPDDIIGDIIVGDASQKAAAANPWMNSLSLQTPYKTELKHTTRYDDPVLGFDPFNPNQEFIYGANQPWYERFSRTAVKSVANFTGGILQTVGAIPSALVALSDGDFSKIHDNAFNNYINDVLEDMEFALPNYDTQFMHDHPILSWVPFIGKDGGLTIPFIGNEKWGNLFKNLAFMGGAIAGSIAQDSLIGMATGGSGVLPLLEPQIALILSRASKIFSAGGKTAQEAFAAVNAGQKAVDVINKAYNTAKVTDRIRQGVMMATNGLSQGIFFGIQARNITHDMLKASFYEKHGRDPFEDEAAYLKEQADAAGNATTLLAAALTMGTDSQVLGSLFKPAAAAAKQVGKEVAGGTTIALKQGSLDVFEEVAKKNKFEILRSAVPTRLAKASVFEGLKFGGFHGISTGAENFYLRKYDEENVREADNLSQSIGHGFHEAFATRQGLESFMMGLMLGPVMHFGKRGMERLKGIENNKKTIVENTLKLLNNNDLSSLFEHMYDESVVSTSIARDMKIAAESGDIFRYKNLQFQQLYNFVVSGVKAGRFELRMEQLDRLKELTPDQFEKMFGFSFQDTSHRTVDAFVDTIKDRAQQIKENYEKVDRVFTNPFKGRGDKDKFNAAAFEEYKFQLAYDMSARQDLLRRSEQLKGDIRRKSNGITDPDRVMDLTTDLGVRKVRDEFIKRARELKELLKTLPKGSEEHKAAASEKMWIENKIESLDKTLETDHPHYYQEVNDILNYWANGNTLKGETIVSPLENFEILNDGRELAKVTSEANKLLFHYQHLVGKEGMTDYIRDVLEARQKIALIGEELVNQTLGNKDAGFEDLQTDALGNPIKPEDAARLASKNVADHEAARIADKLENADNKYELTGLSEAEKSFIKNDLGLADDAPLERIHEAVKEWKDKRQKEQEAESAALEAAEASKPGTVAKDAEVAAAEANSKAVQGSKDVDAPFEDPGYVPAEIPALSTEANKEPVTPAPTGKDRNHSNFSFHGIITRVYNAFSEKMQEAYKKVALTMKPKEILDRATIKVKESTEGQSHGEWKPQGTPGIYRQGFSHDATLMVDGKEIGLIQPWDRLAFRRDGKYLPLREMTPKEYAEITRNPIESYKSFMDGLDAYKKFFDYLIEGYKSGKTEFTNAEIRSKFDVVTWWGGTAWSKSVNTPIKNLEYRAAGDAVLSLPVFYDKETQSYRRTQEPRILNEAEIPAETLPVLQEFIKKNLSRIRDLNRRYVYIHQLPNGTYKASVSVSAARPLAAHPKQLQRVLELLLTPVKDKGDARRLNEEINNLIYIADSNNSEKHSEMVFRVEADGRKFLNIYNESARYGKMIELKDLDRINTVEELVNYLNSEIGRRLPSDSKLDMLNIHIKDRDIKTHIPDDDMTTMKAIEENIGVTVFPQVFNNISIAIEPIYEGRPATGGPNTGKPSVRVKANTRLTIKEQGLVNTVKANLNKITNDDFKLAVEKHLEEGNHKALVEAVLIPKFLENPTEGRRLFGDTIAHEILGMVGGKMVSDRRVLQKGLESIFGLPSEQALAVSLIYDRVAKQWAERHGKTKDDFYNNLVLMKGHLDKLKAPSLNQIIGEQGAKELAKSNPEILEKFELAKKLSAERKGGREIFLATGWQKGRDGKWNYETNYAVSFKLGSARRTLDKIRNKAANLEDILDYPELYEAYPDSRKIKVFKSQLSDYGPRIGASYIYAVEGLYRYFSKKQRAEFFKKGINEGDPAIVISTEDPSMLATFLIHEIQHFVQTKEGFPNGDNRSAYYKLFFNKDGNFDFDAGYKKLNELVDSVQDADFRDVLKDDLMLLAEEAQDNKTKSVLNDVSDNLAYLVYFRVAGEVQARNAQKRANMAPEERAQIPIHFSEDVNRQDQLLFQDSLESRLASIPAEKVRELTDFIENSEIKDAENKPLTDTSGFSRVGEFDPEMLRFVQEELAAVRESLRINPSQRNVNTQLRILKNVFSRKFYEGLVEVGVLTKGDVELLHTRENNLEQGNTYFNDLFKDPFGGRNPGMHQISGGADGKGWHANDHIRNQKAQAAVHIANDGRATIYALTNPNVSSPLHELAHIWESSLVQKEVDTVLKWAGHEKWSVETSEKFARGFEKYLSEGKTDTPSLTKVFENFKEWLLNIYKGIVGSDIDLELNDGMRDVYRRMIGDKELRQLAQKAKAEAREKTTKPAPVKEKPVEVVKPVEAEQLVKSAETAEPTQVPEVRPARKRTIVAKKKEEAPKEEVPVEKNDGISVKDVTLYNAGDDGGFTVSYDGELLDTIDKMYDKWFDTQGEEIGKTRDEAVQTIVDRYNAAKKSEPKPVTEKPVEELSTQETKPAAIEQPKQVEEVVAESPKEEAPAEKTVRDLTPKEYADRLEKMTEEERNEIDYYENSKGWALYEARKLKPKENSDKFRKVPEDEITLEDYEYIANVDGVLYGLNKNESGWDDGDFTWGYTRLDTATNKTQEKDSGVSSKGELIKHIQTEHTNDLKREEVAPQAAEKELASADRQERTATEEGPQTDTAVQPEAVEKVVTDPVKELQNARAQASKERGRIEKQRLELPVTTENVYIDAPQSTWEVAFKEPTTKKGKEKSRENILKPGMAPRKLVKKADGETSKVFIGETQVGEVMFDRKVNYAWVDAKTGEVIGDTTSDVLQHFADKHNSGKKLTVLARKAIEKDIAKKEQKLAEYEAEIERLEAEVDAIRREQERKAQEPEEVTVDEAVAEYLQEGEVDVPILAEEMPSPDSYQEGDAVMFQGKRMQVVVKTGANNDLYYIGEVGTNGRVVRGSEIKVYGEELKPVVEEGPVKVAMDDAEVAPANPVMEKNFDLGQAAAKRGERSPHPELSEKELETQPFKPGEEVQFGEHIATVVSQESSGRMETYTDNVMDKATGRSEAVSKKRKIENDVTIIEFNRDAVPVKEPKSLREGEKVFTEDSPKSEVTVVKVHRKRKVSDTEEGESQPSVPEDAPAITEVSYQGKDGLVYTVDGTTLFHSVSGPTRLKVATENLNRWIPESANDREITYLGLKKILENLRKRLNLDYVVINDPEQKFRGRFKEGKVIINAAHVRRETPFHEYFHPFLKAVEAEHPQLHSNLSKEFERLLAEGDEYAMEAKVEAERQGLEGADMMNEALVGYLGKLSAQNVDKWGERTSRGMLRAFADFIQKIRHYLTNVFQEISFKPKRGFQNKEIKTAADLTLQDVADIVSLTDLNYDLQARSEFFKELDAFQMTSEFETAAIDRIKNRLRVFEDTARRRIPSEELQAMANDSRRIIEGENTVESLERFMQNGIQALRWSNRKFWDVSAQLRDKKGNFSPDEITQINKDLLVVRNAVEFYLRDVQSIFSRVADRETMGDKSYRKYSETLHAAGETIKTIENRMVDGITEWLWPHVENTNKLIAEKYPEYVLSKEDFKKNVYRANGDIDRLFYFFGSVASSKDPFSAVVRDALFKIYETNHFATAETGERIKSAYGDFLKTKGISNDREKTGEYFKQNWLRKASILKKVGEDKDGRAIEEYQDRWAFHQPYFYDVWMREFTEYKKSLGEPPLMADEAAYKVYSDKILAWVTANGDLNKPADRFKNPEFDKLYNSEPLFKEIYDAYKSGNDMLDPEDRLQFGEIPQVSKGKGMFTDMNWSNNKWRNTLRVVHNAILPELDRPALSFHSYNLDGTLHRRMKVPFVRELQEVDLDFALPETVFKFFGSSQLVGSMKKAEPNIMILRNWVTGEGFSGDGRKVSQKIKGIKKLVNGTEIVEGASKEKTKQLVHKQLTAFIDDVVYGQTEIVDTVNLAGREIDLNKLGGNLSFLTALNNMAGNVTAGISNIAIGNIQTLGESLGGRYYSKGDWAWANKEYYAHVNDFLADSLRLKKSKITQLAIMYDAIQGEFRDKFGKRFVGSAAQRFATSDSFFMLTHAGEHEIQIKGMLALLKGTKVRTKDGQEISLYDAHQLDSKGHLRMRDDVVWGKDDIFNFTTRLHAINKNLNGNYSTFDKAYLQRKWYGRLALVYRKYLYNSFRARWGDKRMDYEFKDVQEGYYRTFLKKLNADMKAYGFEAATRMMTKKGWSPEERYAFNKTMYEMSLFVGLTLMGAALGSLDDDSKDKSWAQNYLGLIMLRARADVGMYSAFAYQDIYRTITNPSAVVMNMKRYSDILMQLISDPFQEYERKTGAFDKGDNILWAKIQKAMPLIRQYYNAKSPEEMAKLYNLFNKNF